MSHSSKRVWGVCALVLAGAWPLSASCDGTVDVSTDEAVAHALGVTDPHALCVARPPRLPGIVLTGAMAADRGCVPGPIFVTGHEVRGDAGTRAALAHLGWGRAHRHKKLELAMLWVTEGLMRFEGSVLTAKPDEFNRAFHPPRASVSGGTIHIRLWEREPSGMRCGSAYDEMSFAIALRDGALAGRRSGGSFFVPCHPGGGRVPHR